MDETQIVSKWPRTVSGVNNHVLFSGLAWFPGCGTSRAETGTVTRHEGLSETLTLCASPDFGDSTEEEHI